MKILFASNGEISIPLLRLLAKEDLVSAVLTFPDSPGKRGARVVKGKVKEVAEKLSLDIIEAPTLGREAREKVGKIGADTLISFSYGKIFGPKFLSLFSNTFNVHPSLLPLYRGPSPLYAAISNLDTKTGITVQNISLSLDEGEIYSRMEIELDGSEDRKALEERVANLVPHFFLETIKNLTTPKAQRGAATYTKLIEKEDGKLDFNKSWREVHAAVRSCYPWPKAYMSVDGEIIFITKVYGSAFSEGERAEDECGKICDIVKGKGLKIACSDGYIYAERLQAPTKNETDALSFINGRRNLLGKRAT